MKAWGRYGLWVGAVLAVVVVVGSALWATYYLVARSVEAAQEPAGKGNEVILGLDLSSGSPLAANTDFAAKAAARVRGDLSGLPFRSHVRLRSFSRYALASDQVSQDWEISRNARPGEVARTVAVLIANVPKLVEEQRIEVHPETNILAFLESMAPHLNCAERPTTVILLTDGIEDSELAKLGDMSGSLPSPDREMFKECQMLTMLGIGRAAEGGGVELTRFLRREWANWAQKAGFKEFNGVRDW